MSEENKNNVPHQEEHNENGNGGIEDTLKKAVMATIGTVAGAVEKVGDVISGVVNKENIDKMAHKGEETFKQVKDFTVDTANTVKDFTVKTYDKVKHAVVTPGEEEVSGALNRAADSLKDALDKARGALQRTAGRGNVEKVGNSLLQEMNEQKESMEAFIQKMRDIATEEAEMVKQELAELEAQRDETLKEQQVEAGPIKHRDAEEHTLPDKKQADLNNPDRLGDGEPPINAT